MDHVPGNRNGGELGELRELVGLELKDILATAQSEGYKTRDVLHALELALKAEQDALGEVAPAVAEAGL